MYEHYYGLRERPFDLSSNTKFLFLSPQHHEALTHLRYGLSGRPGITLLVGEAGAGESTLARAGPRILPGTGAEIALPLDPTPTPRASPSRVDAPMRCLRATRSSPFTTAPRGCRAPSA